MGQLGVNNKTEEDDVEIDEEKGNQSEVVRWEKVLPRMVLRVLLVEADDSTRKIIAALLRKCNYKVAAISDGLEAWEILKRRHSNIDLILAELDLPSISGYALLTLIMEHDGYKNIPVVIMSSQDSISMVLKCMLKGAADFLIKPVRKNELKNLWRHVWRRRAVDVGHKKPRNPAIGQHKAETTFENDPASNRSSDNVSSSRKNSKSSQKASNVLDSLQKRRSEGTGLSQKEAAHHADDAPLVEAFTLGSSDSEKEAKFTSGGSQPSDGVKISAAFKARIATEDGYPGIESHRHTPYVVHREEPELSKQAVDLIGGITKHKGVTGQSSSSGNLNMHNPTQELEFTLKSTNDAEMEEVDEMHILNHSKASAFSRYNSNKKLQTIFPSTVGYLKEVEGMAQRSPWPTGNEEIKPKDFVTKSTHGEPSPLSPQVGLFPISGVIFDGGSVCYAPMFQPVYSPPMVPKTSGSNLAFQKEESQFLTSPSLHSVDPSRCSSTPCNNDNVTQQQKSSTAYGSVSDVTDVNATAPSMIATSAIEESVRDDGSNTFDLDKFRSRMGHHHSAEREAALAKFRLKRKGRCFEKKVRYQSRKRLAEQRPRVKGQFVRGAPSDPVITDVDKS